METAITINPIVRILRIQLHSCLDEYSNEVMIALIYCCTQSIRKVAAVLVRVRNSLKKNFDHLAMAFVRCSTEGSVESAPLAVHLGSKANECLSEVDRAPGCHLVLGSRVPSARYLLTLL